MLEKSKPKYTNPDSKDSHTSTLHSKIIDTKIEQTGKITNAIGISKTGPKEGIKTNTTSNATIATSNQDKADSNKMLALTTISARALNLNNPEQDKDIFKTTSNTQETNVHSIGIFKRGF